MMLLIPVSFFTLSDNVLITDQPRASKGGIPSISHKERRHGSEGLYGQCGSRRLGGRGILLRQFLATCAEAGELAFFSYFTESVLIFKLCVVLELGSS